MLLALSARTGETPGELLRGYIVAAANQQQEKLMTTIRVRATFETSVEATDAVGRDGQSLTASEYACSVVQSSILLGSERLHGTAVLSVEVIGNAHTEQKGAGR